MATLNIAERIRQAALGPTPRVGQDWLYGWVGFGTQAHTALKNYSDWESRGCYTFTSATNTERRFFLLFVAEALGQMDLKSI